MPSLLTRAPVSITSIVEQRAKIWAMFLNLIGSIYGGIGQVLWVPPWTLARGLDVFTGTTWTGAFILKTLKAAV